MGSVLLALLTAYVYTQLVPPVYQVRASLLIDKKKEEASTKAALEELDFTTKPKIVESELEILRSRKLMRTVVDELRLPIVYQRRDFLRTEDLYDRSPVRLNLVRTRPFAGTGKHVLDLVLKDQASYYVRLADGTLVPHRYRQLITDKY